MLRIGNGFRYALDEGSVEDFVLVVLEVLFGLRFDLFSEFFRELCREFLEFGLFLLGLRHEHVFDFVVPSLLIQPSIRVRDELDVVLRTAGS